MIYITGDCHGEYQKLSRRQFPIGKTLTKNDYVIICGDFGLWHPSKEQDIWLNWLNELPFTILFCDGNHENYDLLNAYPQEEWCGGRIHKINDSIYHLQRGFIFHIDSYHILVMGGAQSHDQVGIISASDPLKWEKFKMYRKQKLLYRIEKEHYWNEELPSQEEYEQMIQALEKHDYEVDYVITHCAPTSLQQQFFNEYPQNELTDFLEWIYHHVKFKYWYCGHYHVDQSLTKNFSVLNDKIELLK